MKRLVIVTGLSGSGKTLAARCLEDLGFFCADNLPVQLIPPFHELILRSGEPIDRAALVIDVREGRFLEGFPEILRQMRDRGIAVTLLFFECADEILKRRFSESRRPHPMGGEGVSLEDAIRRERDALTALRELADRIIDTTRLTAHELRAFLKGSFGGGAAAQLNVHLMSFGFKYGLPAEADLVFDLRCLPNPYFVDHLRPLDGRSPEVRAFVEAQPEAAELARRLDDLLDFLIPLYDVEGKTYLTVALGCTGGKHRSVAFAEELGRRLGARSIAATVHHRDVGRE